MVDREQTQSPVLCRVEDLAEGSGKEVLLPRPDGMRYLMLFRHGGEVRAWLNTCPHQGRSLSWAPDQFLFGDDGRLVCPHHGATFDLSDGHCVSGPCLGASLTPVSVRVEYGEVVLDGG
ncbi:MAG: Rieske (2Fe-2S) protein [Xanthomonadales bacterium]|nr:Rieske (2Fe-2S) protein [Xanthomonadales bacterium]